MPRFSVTRSSGRVEIAFDDGGVNVLSSEALRELREIVTRVVPSRRSPGGTKDGEEPRSDEREASLGWGSFAALRRSAAAPAQDDTTTPAALLLFRSSHASIFAAGADMAEMAQFTPLKAAEFARLGQETFRAMERVPLITVALIDGDCFGGALDLVFSFDLRLATPRSRFSHPGGKLGIVTGFGGTSRWRKVLGGPVARSLFLGNPVFSAAEAEQVGLVDRVREDFEEDLRRLQSLDPATTEFIKELTIHGERLSRSERLLVAERLGHIYFNS
jgi:enoyl-CoA hydratase/carnithine racemase